MEGHTINCSKCGGTLDVPEGLNSVFCVYCGNKNLITDILEIPGLTLLCLKCEAKNKDENQYCHKCGYILQYICPYCSVLHPLNKKHCPKTGHKLDIKSVLYEDGKNALHHEVEKGQVEAVKTLISLGLDLNLKDVKGITPLAIATFTKNLELIKILLSHCNVKN